MKTTTLAVALTLFTATASAQQGGTLVLPQQKVPIPAPQFGGQTQQQAYEDPCGLTLQNQFNINLSAGSGYPVMDAPTEANTGALVSPTVSTEQNTDISAQLAYNKCLAERQARLNNILKTPRNPRRGTRRAIHQILR